MISSQVKCEIEARTDTRRTKSELSSIFFPMATIPHLPVRCHCPLSCANAPIGHTEFASPEGTSWMGLTARKEGTEWRHGAPIFHLLFERFYGCFSLLQETGRASHGAMSRRRALHRSGCRIQFDRHHRETYGGEHAFALGPFFYQPWRKNRPQPRPGS